MKILKILFGCVIASFLICQQFLPITFAQVEVDDLENYLATINWSQKDLDDYLLFYELTVEDFSDVGKLKQFLGTPISEENLNDLLATFEMTYEDVQTLLLEYGETIADYTFIEDLQLDVEFYLNHHNEFIVINDFLSLFGVTEDEIQKLFNHFIELNKTGSHHLKVSNLKTSVQQLGLWDAEILTTFEQQQILTIWDELFKALKIETNYYLVNDENMKPIEISNILEGNLPKGYSLQLELFNKSDEQLASLIFGPSILNSNLISNALEEFAGIATFSNEYKNLLLDNKLPATATNHINNLIIGLIAVFVGCSLIFIPKIRTVNY